MTLFAILFYAMAALVLLSTALAATRRNMVHAVLCLVVSFFGTAMLFYLLGAPFLAALEIIIYAGAIMVLFLFIIMMIRTDRQPDKIFTTGRLIAAGSICAVFLFALVGLTLEHPGGRDLLMAAQASPAEFGFYVFKYQWLSIEIVSMLLLVALIGALLLGLKLRRRSTDA